MWKLITLLIALAIGAGVAWVMAGRAPGPVIEIREPSAVGQIGTLVLAVEAPHGTLDRLDVASSRAARRRPCSRSRRTPRARSSTRRRTASF
jgi:hypothetical protein